MREPAGLSRRVVDAMQRELISEHGGLHGVRDDGLLESALSRPRNRWSYEPDADLAELAAAYGFGLARNHAYIDGNKRIALAAMHVFVRLNRHVLTAEEPEEVAVMLQVADGSMPEAALASWARERLRSR
ncbi:MAG TPA: type II toxin-antitoxin system death-on-curing family toxin [Longimicrobiaceae bacterium]|nr:type II toxin-antitoxin system death-on-curing family toxin [Longimicrobiaceae bacterium]